MANLGSTLLGGALTVGGGFLATLALRWLDRRRDKQRDEHAFRAAAVLVPRAVWIGFSARSGGRVRPRRGGGWKRSHRVEN
jgi:hypothetical protein